MMRRVYNKGILFLTLVMALAALVLYVHTAFAQPNLEINYQGKLTDSSSVAVTDGEYNMRFFLYNTTGGATTTNIWTEEWLVSASNGVQVTNGLFSTMLGSTTAFTGVDFNQTLYLGVEIGGTGSSPTWDGEMTPRKVLGTVPAAFEAQQLDGLATTSFLRSDQADTLQATESGTLLTLIQDGTGAIFDAINASAESVFKIFESGIVTIGTSTADSIATTTGLAVVNKDVEVRIATGTPLWGVGRVTNGEGGADLLAGAIDVKVRGDYAFVVAAENDAVTVFNISDPTNPTFVSSSTDGVNGVDELDEARRIALSGNYAYVSSRADAGVQILDISDPTDLKAVGSISDGTNGADYLANANDIAIVGNYAFVVSGGDDAVQVLDISDPTNPVGVGAVVDEVGGADTLNNGISIAIQGSYAYVASISDNGVQVIDISDPANPIAVGSIQDESNGADTMANAREIKVSGSYAYVSSLADNGVQVLDISDPTNPTGVGSIQDESNGADTLDDTRGLAIVGDYLLVTSDDDNGVQVLDISDPTNPTGVGSIQEGVNGLTTLSAPLAITVQGQYAYVADFGTNDGLQILSLPSLVTPTANIGNLVSNDIESDYLRVTEQLTADGSLNVGTNALIGGALTITGTASSSLQSTNTNPALTVTSGYVGIGTTTPYQDLSIDGDVAITGALFDNNASSGESGYVLQSTGSGLAWVATSTLGFAADGGGSSLFTDDGDITYLTSLTDVLAIGTSTDIATSTGLAVYNRDVELLLGNPTGLGTSESLAAGLGFYDITIDGDYVYTAGEGGFSDNFEIFDISDPSNPTSVASALNDAVVQVVEVIGNYAYVSAVETPAADDLHIFDVSNPTNPVKVGGISTESAVTAINVQGNYAYIGSSSGGDEFEIFDISDPTNPIKVGGADAATSVNGVEVIGNYAYVISVSFADDLEIFDISDPTNPVKVGGADEGSANDIKVVGSLAYVTSGSEVEIFDVSDPTNPVKTTGFSTDDSASDIEIVGDYALVSSDTVGDVLEIFNISSSTNVLKVGSIDAGVFSAMNAMDVFGNQLVILDDFNFRVYELPTFTTPTANIGNLVSNDIQSGYLRVTQQLTADGSLNVGTNALIGGALTVVGNASSSLQGDITQAALAVTSGGISVGTSTLATSTGLAVYNQDIEIGLATGTPLDRVGRWVGGSIGLTTLEIAGDYAYVGASAADEVYIVDISNKSTPTTVGTYDPGSSILTNPVDIHVFGNYMFVSENSGNSSIIVVDISNPASPTTTTIWEPDDTELFWVAADPQLSGKYLFTLGKFSRNLIALDVSDPTNPVFVSDLDPNSVSTFWDPNAFTIRGNYAYVAASGSDTVVIVDISDPTNMSIVGIWDIDDTSLMDETRDIVLSGNYAYVAGRISNSVAVIDISDPTAPTTTAIWDPNSTSTIEDIRSIEIAGDYVFVNGYDSDSLAILDVSNPANPTLVDTYTNGNVNDAANLVVRGNYLYSSYENFGTFDILKIGGSLTTPTAEIGNLLANDIETDYLRVTQSLIAGGGLNVGTNAMIGGTLTVGGTASSSLINESTDAALAIISGGIGIGTSTAIATTTGVVVYNQDAAVLIGTGTPMWGVGSVSDGSGLATELSQAEDVVVVGDLLYVAGFNDDGIQILDISDPSNPTGIGIVQDGVNGADKLDGVSDIEVRGNYAYVTSENDAALQVLDISDPTNPVGVGDISSSTSILLQGAKSVALQGNLAYVTAPTDNALQIIDISDPTNPIAVGSITDGNSGADELLGAHTVKVRGNYAYVSAFNDNGFQIIDISDPTNPAGLGEISDGSNGATELTGAEDVEISGNYAYVAAATDDGVQIIDISDPANPIGLGEISDNTSGAVGLDGASNLSLAGDYLFVTAFQEDAIQIIDISSSTNPVGIGVIYDETNGADELNGPAGIDVSGNYVYVAARNDNGVQILDLGGFIAPTAEIGNLLAGTINTDYLRVTQALTADSSLTVGANALIGGTLTITGNASSSNQDDVTTAALAVMSGAVGVGTTTDIATTTGLAVYNQDIELLLGEPKLIAEPTITLDTSNVSNIAVSDDLLVATAFYSTAGGEGEIELFDVSNPSNPIELASIDIVANVSEVEIIGNYLYVAAGDGNGFGPADFYIYDISNPNNPIQTGALSGYEQLYDIEVVGNYAFVIGEGDDGGGAFEGLSVINISDPDNPIHVTNVNTGNNAGGLGIQVIGNYAYVVNGDQTQGFEIYDISDPTNPIEIGENFAVELSLDVAVRGGYAYSVTQFGTPEIEVWDVRDPANPVSPRDIALPQTIQSVKIYGDYLFIGTDNNSGDEFRMYDISSSTNPIELSSAGLDLDENILDLQVRDGYLYLLTADSGQELKVYKLPSLITPTAEIGSVLASDIETDYLRVSQTLVADGSLNVGTNALINGSLTITGTASSSLQSGNTNAALVITSGYLAIGTSTPYAEVSLVGDMAITGGIYDNNASLGSADYVLRSTGTGVEWVDLTTLGIGSGSNTTFTDGGDITYLTSLTDVLAIGTTTDIATSTGLAVYNRDIQILQGSATVVGTSTNGVDGASMNGPTEVIIVDDIAYVTSGSGAGALQAIDVSDPSNPVILDAIADNVDGADALLGAWDIEIVGDYAYVSSDNGLQILDISNPNNLVGLGELVDGVDTTLLGGDSRLDIQGKYAYITAGTDNAVVVADISNPNNPIVVGSITDENNGATQLDGAADIIVDGNYAYVAALDNDGLQILDISDPTNPIGVGAASNGTGGFALNGARTLAKSGNLLYVANQVDDGIMVVDVSDPTNPVAVQDIFDGLNGIDILNSAYGLDIAGNYLYVYATQENGIQIIDVSSSTNPIHVWSVTDGNDGFDLIQGDSGNWGDIAVYGNYLYVVTHTDDSLTIAELDGFFAPAAEIGRLASNDIETNDLDVNQNLSTGDSINIATNAMVGGTLTVAGNASSGNQFNVTEAALGIVDGSVLIGTSTDIATSTGLAVYNQDIDVTIGTGSPLVAVGSIGQGDSGALLDGARGIAVQGSYAYVTAVNEDTLQILDISDPANPIPLGSSTDLVTPGVDTMIDPVGVEVRGNYAYVVGGKATGRSGLQIIDVSNPSNPIGVGSVSQGERGTTELQEARAIALKGNYAFVTGLTSWGVEVIDISDPTYPYSVGAISSLGNTLDGPRDIKIRGNYAYVTTGSTDSLTILDISDPTNPITIGALTDTVETALDLANFVDVQGKYAYVTAANGGAAEHGLQIIDISDPTNPTAVASTSAGLNGPHDVKVVGDYAFIASQLNDKIQVVDVSSSTNPTIIGEVIDGADGVDEMNDPDQFAVKGQYLFVTARAGSDSGVQVFKLPSIVTPSASIGNLLANGIETNFLRVTQALATDSSLNVGAGLSVGGTLTVTGTASSSLISGNTNAALTVLSGYVGIGTSTPYADLSVAGDVAITGGVFDNNGSLGSNGDILRSTGSGLEWISTTTYSAGSLFTDGGDITYLTSLTDVLAIGTSTNLDTTTGVGVTRDVEVFVGDLTQVGSMVVTSGQARDFVVRDDIAYVVSNNSGDDIEMIDISDPTNPSRINGIDVGGVNVRSVDIEGNYLYVGRQGASDGFKVFDISNPAVDSEVASVDTSGSVFTIAVEGGYAYLGQDGAEEIQVWDVSDPTNPFLVDGVAAAAAVDDLVVRGKYLYAVSNSTSDDLEIFDISDPTNIVKVGGDGFSADNSHAVALNGNIAYVGGNDLFTVLDISDPANPIEIQSIVRGATNEDVRDLVVSGDYLYMGTTIIDGDELDVYDISSSTNPVKVGKGDLPDDANAIAIQGEYLYAISEPTGDDFHIFKLPTLTTPTASIGNLLSDDIETSYLTVTQALRADSLNVNTNAMVGGALTITGTASSSLISSNSNTALTITSGFVQIGTSTNATSGIQIGYGAICVDNDGACTASTTGRISSVSTYSGNSDLAETYFSADDLSAGDIVTLEENLSVSMANRDEDKTIIGVVSTKPGVLLGFDDVSLEDGEVSYPIALKGRVPVKVTTENGPINPGDQLMLSSIPGMAMKATGTGAVVGIALEAFDPAESDQYFSDTFINQFTDDLPSTEDVEAVIEELTASTTETIELDNDDVQQGQIVMFVDLSYRYIDEQTNQQLTTLMEPADDADDTIFDRITNLAKSFVGGVLSIARLNVDEAKVEVVCVEEGVCLDSGQLQELLERAGTVTPSITDVVTNPTPTEPEEDNDNTSGAGSSGGGVGTPDSTTPQNPATTTNSGENTASTTDEIGDTNITASTTTTGGDLVNSTTTSPTENTEIEPQNTDEDVQLENVEETTVADEEPQAEETPVSSDVGEAETPEEETPPEPEPVEEVDTPVVEEPVATEEVNQETS